jgi:hypothetical protein
MATATLSSTPTIIDLAESISAWGGDTFVLEGDDKVQGSNSVSCTFTPNAGTSQDVYVSGSWNLSAGVHLRLWMKNTISGYLQTETNNGIQIFVYDGTNYDLWTVGGGDTYAGGWKQFVVDTASTPTSGGSANHASLTRIGIRMSVHTRPKNAVNLWLDAWYYGPGYVVTGGTSGDEIDWSHVAALDLTNAYGIITRIDDIYFSAGDIKIGNGATTTYFKSNQKVQFKDLPVASDLYAITFQGSACNVDIYGGSFGAAGSQNFLFDASDTNINSFSLTGVQFSKVSNGYFSAGQTVTNSVFDNCGQVDPSTSTFTGHRFTNSTDTNGAVLWPSDDTNINNLQFSICDLDIEYDASSDSTPNFVNIVHDDNPGDYDVNNTSGSAVTIPLSGTSNGNSYTGSTVTFEASVTLSFKVTDAVTGGDIQYARINIVNASTKAQLYQIETNSSGVATQAHTYAGDLNIEGWIRQFDISGSDYIPVDFAGQITSSGFQLSAKLTPY